MRVKFEGDMMSAWANLPGYDELPGVCAFFPYKVSYPPNITYGESGHPLSLKKGEGVLCFCESDEKTIRLNERTSDSELVLQSDTRLIDTRHGLILRIEWTFAAGKPQGVSVEHFLDMHNGQNITLLQHVAKQEFLPFLYCDTKSLKVARHMAFPVQSVAPHLGMAAEAAARMVNSEKTYAREMDMRHAMIEAANHVDELPGPRLVEFPEATYKARGDN